jgi:HK97 family phage major capsid protein
LIYKLPAGYRDSAAFAMATTTEGALRALTGNPFQLQNQGVNGGVGAANPQRPFGGGGIMGYPTFNSAAMAAIATGNKTVLFGNWDFYAFVERAELVVQRNEYLYMANGQVGIFANWRWGGAVLQAEAFQYLQQA